jgi:hypothetical protein
MGLKHELLNIVNGALAPRGFKIERIVWDFDARLDKPEQLRRIFCDFTAVAEEWLSRQTIFPVKNSFPIADDLQLLFERYLSSPFRQRHGGTRFNGLAWLFVIAKAMKPEVIIDSGTYKGGSAWVFAQAVPEAKILSFDIDLSNLALRMDGVTYTQSDWTDFDWRNFDIAHGLIYFDDHLDQARRLIEAAKVGLPVAIFDDDFPVTAFADMAHNGIALPKIEFVLDDKLGDWEEVSWIDRSGKHSFPLRREYLDKARSLIEKTERLPNTSYITGIHHLPHRIVKIRV